MFNTKFDAEAIAVMRDGTTLDNIPPARVSLYFLCLQSKESQAAELQAEISVTLKLEDMGILSVA